VDVRAWVPVLVRHQKLPDGREGGASVPEVRKGAQDASGASLKELMNGLGSLRAKENFTGRHQLGMLGGGT